MFPTRFACTILALCSTAFGYSQFTDVINSNRPGKSMAAFSVGQSVFQVEAGLFAIDEDYKAKDQKGFGLGSEMSLRYGAFLEQLEFNLDLQYQYSNYEMSDLEYKVSGLRQMTIGAKYLVYDPYKNFERKPNLYSWKANHKFIWRQLIPAIGIYAGANLNLFNDGFAYEGESKISPKVVAITQNQFGKHVLVMNFIGDKLGSDYMMFGGIITLTRGFNEQWSGFIEAQGYKSDYRNDIAFRLGAAYLIKENLQIDASIGANIKDNPSYLMAGLGVSWRFDENYKEVYLRIKGDDKKDKKGKDKKDKKKKNKRIDEVGGETE